MKKQITIHSKVKHCKLIYHCYIAKKIVQAAFDAMQKHNMPSPTHLISFKPK